MEEEWKAYLKENNLRLYEQMIHSLESDEKRKRNSLKELGDEIAQLKSERDSLRCCGNCEQLGWHGDYKCLKTNDFIAYIEKACDNWKQRERGE